jgi:two-component system cell cycle response regulator
MKKFLMDNIEIDKLKDRINEVRDILNQICCTLDGNEGKEYLLKVSEELDELIVEYMKQNNICYKINL